MLPKQDDTIAISSQLAQLHKLKVGDTLKVGQNDLNKKLKIENKKPLSWILSPCQGKEEQNI